MAIATMRVPTIFTAVDKFSDVVSKMTRKTAAFGETAQAAAMRTSRRFNSAGNVMLGAGVGIATGLGYAVNEAMNFEDKMANINTILNATPQALNEVKKTIFQVGKQTGVPLNDLVTNFYELSSAQIYGAKANEALEQSARLSVLGLGDMTASTNIMISTLNGFKREGLSAVEVTEKIARTIQKGKLKVSDMNEAFAKNGVLVGLAGVKLDEYLSMQAAMTTAGMPINEAQNALGLAAISLVKMGPKVKKVAESMNINPSEIVKLQKVQQGLFKGLNIKTGEDLVTKMGGMVPAMIAMTSQAKKMGVPIEMVFGRQGAIIANALLTGDALKEYNIEMDYLAKKGINVADAMYKVKQQTSKFKFNILKNEVKELAIKIGDVLLPRVNDLFDSASKMVGGLASWGERNRGFANTLMTVAKWLLILGVVAKVGAFLFYGWSVAIGVVSAVTSAYKFVMLMASLANVGFMESLWGCITAMGTFLVTEIAILAPLLLIVAALGLLTYAFWESGDSTESMVDKQIYALNKGNSAWVNSTDVMSKELEKQKRLTSSVKPPKVVTHESLGKYFTASSPGLEGQAKYAQNQYVQSLVNKKEYGDKAVFSAIMLDKSMSGGINKNAISTNTPDNLAGKNKDYSIVKDFINGKTGILEVRVTTDEGSNANVVGNAPKGIKVVTSKNQGTRGTGNTH